MGRLSVVHEKLVKEGKLGPSLRLLPTTAAATLRGNMVIDGPFAETKEVVAGYWIWNVKNMAEAVEWVKKCPNPMRGDSEIEIRQIYSAEDFGDALTPELRAPDERLRKQAQSRD
jgi:hypothetical protein